MEKNRSLFFYGKRSFERFFCSAMSYTYDEELKIRIFYTTLNMTNKLLDERRFMIQFLYKINE
jgi:hypothetical protein